jgi:hypothetical protein
MCTEKKMPPLSIQGGLVCTLSTKQGIGGKGLLLGQMRQVDGAAALHILSLLWGGITL